ncbi:MAG: threonine synthase [Chloroflexi bacterium]|nr:MAG: threonine synthase [Chloroflexota bacterium]
MPYHNWFQCTRGCGRRYSIYDVVYRCEDCGGLLDVEHDLEALKERSADEWRALFDQRTRSVEWPYGSGVWGKKEWVCPQIALANVVSLGEGNTALLRVERLGREIGLPDLWVKQCGTSHTGSFKDLGMTVLVSVVKQMIADGKPIRAVACASTGDTSAALAAYCAAAGIPAIVFLPRGKVSTAQLVQPIAHGALVLALDTDFDGCMRIVQQVTADRTIYLANSMNSLRIEGQKTVGIEIVQQLGWEVPDWIIIPAGNLGNVSALGRGLLMMKELGLIDRLPRIACAQAANANPLYLSYLTGFREYRPVSAQKTLASAIQIGAPVSYERAVKVLRAFAGVVEQASEDELADAAARADRAGLYCCPQTGVALAALFKLVKKGEILPEHRVVVISTAHGLKFTGFKVGYHERTLADVVARHANPPLELPANVGAVKEAIDRALRTRMIGE